MKVTSTMTVERAIMRRSCINEEEEGEKGEEVGKKRDISRSRA